MEDAIVGFATLCGSAYPNEAAEPFAVAVLLASDLLIVDLNTPGYPCFQNPYPMDIHESPVTTCTYLADCPSDLIALYYSAGAKQKRTGFVDKPWPVSGGAWGVSASGKEEIILTGHADGSLKFWNAASEQLQLLYKMKTGRHFERCEESAVRDMEPLAVAAVALCPDSLLLAVAGRAAQVTLFKFLKTEAVNEVPVLDVPILYMAPSELEEQASASKEQAQLRQASTSSEASVATSVGSRDLYFPMKARGGPLKRPSGYQPDLVCLTPWLSPARPEEVTSLALNSAYGLMAYGTGQGVAVIDILQRVVVMSLGSPELYPSGHDPFTRLAPSVPSTSANPAKSPSAKVDERGGEEGGRPASPPSPTLAHPASAAAALLHQGGGGSAEESGGSLPPAAGRSLRKGGSGERSKSQGREEVGTAGGSSPSGGGGSVGLSVAASLRKPFAKAVSIALPSASAPGADRPSLEASKSVSPGIVAAGEGDSARPRFLHASHSLAASATSSPHSQAASEKDVSMSRSSSLDSNDAPLCSEAVTCLAFLSSYVHRGSEAEGMAETPALWLGTSTGSVLLMSLSIPPASSRLTALVTGAHSPSIFRGRGAILELGFMDSSFSLLTGPTDKKAMPKEGQPLPRNKVVYKSKISVLSSSEEDSLEEEYVVSVSERSIQVIQLPAQATVYTTRVDSGLVKATVTTLQSSPIVVGLSGSGRVQVYSLPSLRPLLDRPLLPSNHGLGRRTLAFSHDGHGALMLNGSEMEKLSICAEMGRQCSEALGDLFVGQALPEREKPGFLKGIFTSASATVDRDEIFRAEAGRVSKTVARTIQGTGMSAVSAADIKGDGPMAAVAKTKLALIERSEKLSKVEEATATMADSSERYAKHANELMNKMKNKKWYQW